MHMGRIGSGRLVLTDMKKKLKNKKNSRWGRGRGRGGGRKLVVMVKITKGTLY